MYKAIVCDFSYSLLGKDDAIAVDVMLEVDRIRNKGAIFIIATGHSPVTIFDYNRSYIFSDYVVAYDGAYVYDLINDKEIYSKKISLANVKKIYSKFKNYNVVFYTINNSYYIGDFNIKIADSHPDTGISEEHFVLEVIPMNSMKLSING